MEVGYAYEVDRSRLPNKAPGQLKAIRTVMVSEKTETTISVVFPSNLSLQTFFGDDGKSKSRRPSGMMQPNLDEKYAMSLNLAREVLSRQVSFEEYAARRGTRGFWVANVLPSTKEAEALNATDNITIGDGSENEGSLFEGKLDGGTGLTQWGMRQRATLIGKHREKNDVIKQSNIVSMDDDEVMEVEEGDEDDGSRGRSRLRTRKRKSKGVMKSVRKSKINESKLINPKNRWTEQRYKLAEKNILKVMKATGAVYGRPILRPELRTEARKLIGDTGLLDHLLKHMAGKVAPGGKERFRRRHNPEGAMEYWLESADLVNIRKDAGIDDPYWTPPPGWKPGDSPTQDAVCARELKQLKEEVANIKRELQELASRRGNHQALVAAQTSSDGVHKMDARLLMPLKVMHEELLKRKAKVEEQMLVVAKSIQAMEEDVGKLIMEAKGKRVAAADVINEAEFAKDKKEREKASPAMEAAAEGKAARRQRLKSGFRICKPEGTFLWPDMAASTFQQQVVVVPVEDLLVVHTPPSVSSATSKPPPHLLFPPPPSPAGNHHHLQPAYPAKPVAERVPKVTVTASTVSRRSEVKDNISSHSNGSISAAVPDLNEFPRYGTTTIVGMLPSYYADAPPTCESFTATGSGTSSEPRLPSPPLIQCIPPATVFNLAPSLAPEAAPWPPLPPPIGTAPFPLRSSMTAARVSSSDSAVNWKPVTAAAHQVLPAAVSPATSGHSWKPVATTLISHQSSKELQGTVEVAQVSKGTFTACSSIAVAACLGQQLKLGHAAARRVLSSKKMMSPKRPKERTAVDTTQSRSLARHVVTMPKLEEFTEKVEVGSFYEIDRSKLPLRTPVLLLNCVRVVMVTVKTELNVTVRYPSTKSLETYFENGDGVDQEEKLYPAMDEKFVMGPQLAAEVLVRYIPSREFAENRRCKSFWLVQCLGSETISIPVSICNSSEDKSKKGTCLFELQGSRLKGWGIQRLVAYVSNHAENSESQYSISSSHLAEEEREKSKGDVMGTKITRSRKRRRQSSLQTKRIGTWKHDSEQKTHNHKTKVKQEVNYIDRWPAERYERAKMELLEVMKARGAVFGNPISRTELRAEARKRVGDTGLLDHLLKHMAGQLAPGGGERFRRRFDPEGVMEYWLESADLVNVRKEAGVHDPFWTPPPGWHPGDPTCTHGSDCAVEKRLLKEELTRMKRKMQELASMKQEDVLALGVTPDCLRVLQPMEKLDIDCLEHTTLKEKYEDLLKRKAILLEQLLEISDALKKMEEDVEMLAFKAKEETKPTCNRNTSPSSTITTVSSSQASPCLTI
ncbi:hypothetical protein Nepgr_000820 [Nepenthes gracilis]|uniref:PTC1-like winged helix-turn-helix domain-containing protein n=1 Tax=Nepenthes gracilis TaxID=150966 RepID=A0AAD3P3V1_NEPGR|nr:hypothetical protein Nepgr_000820 [Nepenthes gracilis]